MAENGQNGADAPALPRRRHIMLECQVSPTKFMIEKKSRILIADDFEEIRTALTLMLKYAGFDVIEVENGRQAAEAGGSEYLSKPIEIAELKKLIEGCLTVS